MSSTSHPRSAAAASAPPSSSNCSRSLSAADVELIEINVDEGDVDARRFYERHRFAATDPDSGERALYHFRELPG